MRGGGVRYARTKMKERRAVLLEVTAALRLPHRVVVGAIDHHDLGAVALDRPDARLAGVLVHVDHRAEAHRLGRPGHAAPMIAVGRAGEGDVADLFLKLRRGQLAEGDFQVVQAEHGLQRAVNRVRPAQHLERAERQPGGFVFHPDAAQAEHLREVRQALQRAEAVAGDLPVEAARQARGARWQQRLDRRAAAHAARPFVRDPRHREVAVGHDTGLFLFSSCTEYETPQPPSAASARGQRRKKLLTTNQTFAGRSARRRILYGYHSVP